MNSTARREGLFPYAGANWSASCVLSFWFVFTAIALPGHVYGQRSVQLTAAQTSRISAAGEDTAVLHEVALTVWKGFDLAPLHGATSCAEVQQPNAIPSLAVGDRVRNHQGAEGIVLDVVNDEGEVSVKVSRRFDVLEGDSINWALLDLDDLDFWSPDSITLVVPKPGKRTLLRIPESVPTEPCAYLGERIHDWMVRTASRSRQCRQESSVRTVCAFQAASGLAFDPALVATVQSEFQASVAVRVVATYRIASVLGAMTRTSGGEGPSDLDQLDGFTSKYLTLLYGSPRDTTILTTRTRTWRTPRTIIKREVVKEGEGLDVVSWTWMESPRRR